MTTPDDPLEDLLIRMRSSSLEQPESVTEDVWRRIAESEAVARRTSILGRIELAFSRPAFAAAFVAACMACGLFLAEIRISKLHAADSVMIEKEYMRLIAPLLTEPPATPVATPEATR